MNPRTRLAEVVARMETIQADVTEIDANEAPSDEDATRAEELGNEFTELDAERAKLEADVAQRDAIKAASLKRENVEAGMGAPNVVIRKDPFEGNENVRWENPDSEDLIARAVTGISESKIRGVEDAHIEEAVKKIENVKGAAALALATGSPAYRAAFSRWLSTGGQNVAYTPEEAHAVRASLSLTSANGGYALPFLLDPTLIYTGTLSKNPMRRISRVETGTANVWHGVTAGAVTTYWVAENTALTDGTGTTGGPAITAAKLTAYVTGSYEIFEDSSLQAQLPSLIGEAIDDAEGAAFVTGSGSGAPKGIVTAISGTAASTVTCTTRAAFTTASAVDIFALLNAVPSRFEDSATWVGNKQTFNTIKQMSTGSQGSYFWTDFNQAIGSPLLGSPIAQSATMATAQTSGTKLLVLGDFSRFLIYDRLGTTVEFVQNVVDGSGLPLGSRGLIAHKRVGSDVTDVNAFRILNT